MFIYYYICISKVIHTMRLATRTTEPCFPTYYRTVYHTSLLSLFSLIRLTISELFSGTNPCCGLIKVLWGLQQYSSTTIRWTGRVCIISFCWSCSSLQYRCHRFPSSLVHNSCSTSLTFKIVDMLCTMVQYRCEYAFLRKT